MTIKKFNSYDIIGFDINDNGDDDDDDDCDEDDDDGGYDDDDDDDGDDDDGMMMAIGIDGIYPDMITHLGQHAIDWLAAAMTNIVDDGVYPQKRKHARVVAILKPGKPANEASLALSISDV
ncbi:hypothetical protein ElyMa_004616500 [Elysia marginata]|uniref:Uncharacterized protein n=1 Tax=Elysia marginata TaxID=1093978 RepID=A0AAV4HX69_9GAST|nr:hypothetical protein ElyMa_004616500 [Elysia marginata]